VSAAEDQEVLHRLLAKIMVDPVNLIFLENRSDHVVQLAGGSKIPPKRLFDDDMSPAFPLVFRLRETRHPEVADDDRKEARGRGQVEQTVAVGSALTVQLVQLFLMLCVGGRIAEVVRDVMNVAREGVLNLVVGAGDIQIFLNGLLHLVSEGIVGIGSFGAADHGKAVREQVRARQVIESGNQLAFHQVSRSAKNHHRARLRNAMSAWLMGVKRAQDVRLSHGNGAPLSKDREAKTGPVVFEARFV